MLNYLRMLPVDLVKAAGRHLGVDDVNLLCASLDLNWKLEKMMVAKKVHLMENE